MWYIVVGIILILIVLSKYNKIVKLHNKVKMAKSGIDVYLNQRFDLIPNLVECVKAYSKHEKEIIENITELRASYMKSKENDLKKAEKLNNEINQLVAVAEKYPELKASEQYLNLQKNLSKTESQLQAARRIFNNEVTSYNTTIKSVPTNVVARIFGFKEEKLFEIEDTVRKNINIDIEG